MEMYNGQYEQCLEVIITAEYHEECVHIASKILYLCKAWSHNVKYDQHKSARKGDVLRRGIMIYQTAFATDIITFRESLNCICDHYGMRTSVVLIIRSTIPKDSRINLLK